MASIVGIIPARYASTRFPGKPLADIAGRPMIQHVYDRVCRASLIDEVMVATDDQRIFDAVRRFGGEVIMTSPDHQTGTDRLAEVAKRLSAVEIIVNIQGDEPLIDPDAIDAVAAPLRDDPTIPMCSVMAPMPDAIRSWDANVVKVVTDLQGFALYFSRAPIPSPREALTGPGPWKKHIGLYAYRRDFLLTLTELAPTPLEKLEKLEQLRVLENGYRIKMVERTEDSSIGVDTPEDLERVRAVLESRLVGK
ncbi:MAG TPA: 3-deoxy-manno-octulosonate cytidylyltransferase [Armatimonadota bacterium]|nr:3-deoxy-manno-octulosonate cytidylyltransferase [Armatimonadota bacterium]